MRIGKCEPTVPYLKYIIGPILLIFNFFCYLWHYCSGILRNDMAFHNAVLLTFTLSISGFLAVGILLLWHTYLIITNQVDILIVVQRTYVNIMMSWCYKYYDVIETLNQINLYYNLSWNIYFILLYVVISFQTTIEFYVNMEERAYSKEKGEIYKNPFHQGWSKNMARVFGDTTWFFALLPSLRPPAEPMYPLVLRRHGRGGGDMIV